MAWFAASLKLPMIMLLLLAALLATVKSQTGFGPYFYPNGVDTDPIFITFGEFSTTHFYLNIFITGEHWFGFAFASGAGCTPTSTTCSMSQTDAILFGWYGGTVDPLTAKEFKLGNHNIGIEHAHQNLEAAVLSQYSQAEQKYQYNANIRRPYNPSLYGDRDGYTITYPFAGHFCWLWAQGNTMNLANKTSASHLISNHECIDWAGITSDNPTVYPSLSPTTIPTTLNTKQIQDPSKPPTKHPSTHSPTIHGVIIPTNKQNSNVISSTNSVIVIINNTENVAITDQQNTSNKWIIATAILVAIVLCCIGTLIVLKYRRRTIGKVRRNSDSAQLEYGNTPYVPLMDMNGNDNDNYLTAEGEGNSKNVAYVPTNELTVGNDDEIVDKVNQTVIGNNDDILQVVNQTAMNERGIDDIVFAVNKTKQQRNENYITTGYDDNEL